MDDKIFIKENEPKPESNSFLMIAVAIAIILLLGLGVYLVVSNGGSSDDANSNDNEDTVAEDDTATDDDTDTTDEETDTDTPTDEEPAPPTDDEEEEPTGTPTDPANFAPPTDESKIHLYFPKSSGGFGPVLRDKPENIFTDVIVEVLRGPSADERSAGFQSTWQFSGTSKCSGSSSTFRYQVSGSTMTVTLCKDFSGSDIQKFQQSLEFSLSEATEIEGVKLVDFNGTTLAE